MSKTLATAAIFAAAVADAIPVAPRAAGSMFGRNTYFVDPVADPTGNNGPTGATGNAPRDARAEFTTLQGEANALIQLCETEGRQYTAAEKAAQDKRFDRMRALADGQTEAARFAGLAFPVAGAAPGKPGTTGTPGTVQTPANAPGADVFGGGANADDARLFSTTNPDTLTDVDQRRFAALYKAAVNEFIRTGDVSHVNKFTLTTSTSGGVMAPLSVGQPIVIKRIANQVRAALAAYGLQPMRTASSEAINIPVFDDSANSADVANQNATGDNPKDPAATAVALGAKLYDSGTVWMANLFLLSLDFDLIGFIQPMLDARIDYTQSVAWFTSMKTAATGVTAATATGFTYANLLSLQTSIPLNMRVNGVFFVSDGAMTILRGMVDTTGRPLFQVSMRDGAPDTLLGWPIFVTDQLATPATGQISMIVASLTGLFVRDIGRPRVVRYVDDPQHPDQFGLREFAYGDMAYHANAVRKMIHP